MHVANRLIIATSLALLVSALLRGGSPYVAARFDGPLQPQQWWLQAGFLAPQNLRIDLDLRESGRVNLYLLNRAGVESWLTSKEIWPIVRVENFSGGIIEYSIPTRGEYAFLLVNDGAEAVTIHVSITFYGIEIDIVAASLIVGASGFPVWLVLRHYKKRKDNLNS